MNTYKVQKLCVIIIPKLASLFTIDHKDLKIGQSSRLSIKCFIRVQSHMSSNYLHAWQTQKIRWITWDGGLWPLYPSHLISLEPTLCIFTTLLVLLLDMCFIWLPRSKQVRVECQNMVSGDYQDPPPMSLSLDLARVKLCRAILCSSCMASQM
jgi:hypothetical protein